MTNPVKVAAEKWQADAIENCMTRPEYAAKVHSGAWCAACDMSRPCLCDLGTATRKMRAYYEANRRTVFRAEPTSRGSWGSTIDTFMETLYDLATAEHKKVIADLRRKLASKSPTETA